jgi:endo-1,4-beta-xylanase
MKNTLIFFGFVVLAVIITFALTKCGKSPDEENNPSTPSTPSTPGIPSTPGTPSTPSTPGTISTTPLDPKAAGVQTFTSNSGGNKKLSNPIGYEMWTEGGNNNKLIWYGPNQGGGAAFRAEWNNPNDFLGRVGYFWGKGGQFTQYKNMYADYNYTRSGKNTAGSYSYIGIYGWARNPSAANADEKLIEYYIVEDWFGNQWQDDTSPMGTGTTQGSVVGSYTLDGAAYKVIKNVRVNKPSIDGDKTFTQYFSIRQTLRKTGTISITEHFKKWDGLGMKLGNMYEAKFLVEAGGGTGWLEFTWLKFSQEDSPR